MVFEGIVVSKLPYKERDLIVKLLLRNGLTASVYVYGGQGGGKHHKPVAFEVACMMRVQIRERRSLRQDVSELMVAEEFQRLWEPKHIRHDVQAYYLVCLYLEIVQKFALTFHPENPNDDHDGVFTVLSNALFYIDDALAKKSFSAAQHLSLFMVKLLFHLGIMPDTDSCGYCSGNLLEGKGASFLIEQGQFSCLDCVTAENEKGLLFRIKKGMQTRYQAYEELTGTSFQETDKLIQYFCHHFHLRPVELKSYSLLFK